MNANVAGVPGDGSAAISTRTSSASREQLRVKFYSALIVADSFAIALAFVAGLRVTGSAWAYAFFLAPTLVLYYLGLAIYNRVYTVHSLRHWIDASLRAYISAVFAYLVTLGTVFFVPLVVPPKREVLALSFMLSLVLLAGVRGLAAAIGTRMFGRRIISEAVVIDGLGHKLDLQGQDVCLDARELNLIPRIDDPVMLDRIGRAISGFDRVMIACPAERRIAWARAVKGSGVRVELLVPELSDLGPIGTGNYLGHSTAVVADGALALRERAIKRSFDIAVTLPAVIFLLPLFLAVALLIKLDSPGSIFFVQKRVGQGNKLFYIYKFRSMLSGRLDANAEKLVSRDDDRVTRIGRILRRTSIDELPQLFNVLRGDMSLVGPRPHAPGALAGTELYWEVDERYFNRHAAKPGLTGLAQVRGFRGNTTTSADLVNRLQADLEYLSRWTIWVDISILLQTSKVMFHINAF